MMTKITFLLFACCAFSIVIVKAQENIGGQPYSFDSVLPWLPPETKVMPRVDVQALRTRNTSARVRSGQPFQCGTILSSDFSLTNSGTWTVLPNGDRVWRLKIEVPEALATSLYYEDFQLPVGAKLYVYNEDKTHVIGGYTSRNNQAERYFATEMVYSSRCIVEYYEPAAVKGKGQFRITGVSNVFEIPAFVAERINGRVKVGESGSCEVNVNCPEGANWQDEKKSEARILLRVGTGAFLCSGTLLNNAAQNDKPYFLTADHCGGTASAADFNQWIFYFNFEAPSCANPSSDPASQTITGCVQRARSGDNGSDFQLLEFTSTIPTSYNVYYAGWDAKSTASGGGVGIHHPAGDIKKISTYTATPTSESATHWRVYWVQTTTNWGVTEGGSSGSGLFNSAGQIIGDLTGGASSCGASSADAWDVYGKVAYSWTSNGTATNRQLKPWLDPANTGALTLNGKYAGTTGSAPIVNITAPANGAIFPAPSNITITANASDADGSVTQVQFFNGTQSLGTDTSSPYSIVWNNVGSGTYNLTARATDNSGLTTTSSVVTITVGTSTGTDITNLAGTITAQYTDSPSGEDIAKVIDNSSATKYLTFHASGWIQFQASASYLVTRYSLTSANDAPERDPLTWTLQGSANGTTWATLDSRTNEDFPNRFQRREFSFSNTTAYTYYRLQMSNNSGTILQLAEWEIFGTPATTSDDITNLAGTITGQYNDSPSGEDIAKVIDNSSSTKYLTFHNTAWIQFQSTGSYVVTMYSITSANDAPERDPLTWTFQGSANGTAWTTLETRTNQDFPTRFQRREFSFSNTTSYAYYRLQMTNNSGTILQLAEWEIFGTAPASASLAGSEKATEFESSETFRFYPNPARGTVNIIGSSRVLHIQLIDIQGRLVRSWGNIQESPIDVRGVAPGVYWLRVFGKEGKRFEKLVIE